MKIIVYGIRGFPLVAGGAERHCEELYPRLADMGNQVLVLTRQHYFDHYSRVNFKSLPFIEGRTCEVMSHSILCTFYALWHKPDVVHIHNMGACLLTPLLKLRGIKVVLTIHSINYQHKKWNAIGKVILKLCEWIGVKSTDKVIVVSKDMYSYYAKLYGKDKLSMIPNGVNEPEYVPANRVLHKYNLNPKQYIMAIGRFAQEKGFVGLIKAYRDIKEPEYKLVIVGDAVNDMHYKALMHKAIGDDPNIVLTGFLFGKELAEVYTNAGMFVSNSTHEGFPLIVLEALSYGLPVLISNIAPHKELHLPSFRYFHYEELCIKLQQVMSMGISEVEQKRHRQMLKEYYDWDSIAKTTNGVYQSAKSKRDNTSLQKARATYTSCRKC